MGKMKELHMELAQFIDNEADRETLFKLFTDVRGGSSSEARKATAKTIIDLRSIYGENLDRAVLVLLNLEQNDKVSQCGEENGIT